jgi:hypothetical protein
MGSDLGTIREEFLRQKWIKLAARGEESSNLRHISTDPG